jgi:pyrimidine operon attenuation protein/uracil phosphoribosyltransferase
MKTVIMDSERIARTLKRIAFQVLEEAYQEKSITLIGVEPRGVWVADQVKSALHATGFNAIDYGSVHVDQLDQVEALRPLVKGKLVVLIDDVVKSGHTMMLAAASLLELEPKMLHTACLVDRKHRRFPIQSDFTGLSLGTTLQEHIALVIKPTPVLYLE